MFRSEQCSVSKSEFDLQWQPTFQGIVQVLPRTSELEDIRAVLGALQLHYYSLFIPVLYSRFLFLHIINGFVSKGTWRVWVESIYCTSPELLWCNSYVMSIIFVLHFFSSNSGKKTKLGRGDRTSCTVLKKNTGKTKANGVFDLYWSVKVSSFL